MFTALKILAGTGGVLHLLQFLLFFQLALWEFGTLSFDMLPVLAIAAVRIDACAGGKPTAPKYKDTALSGSKYWPDTTPEKAADILSPC
jgi:hypothetical protein